MEPNTDDTTPRKEPEGTYLLGLPGHAVRMFLVLATVATAALTVRSFLVPDTFGQYGFYDGNAIRANMAYPIHHWEPNACWDCHRERSSAWSAGAHKTVSCENCHGAGEDHVAPTTHPAPRFVLDEWLWLAVTSRRPMAKDDSPEACLVCHKKLRARPAVVPQVADLETHMTDQGMTLADAEGKCTTCHDPHAPTP